MCTCVDFNTVEQQICGKSGLGCRAAGHHTGGSKVGHGLLGYWAAGLLLAKPDFDRFLGGGIAPALMVGTCKSDIQSQDWKVHG